MDFTETSAGGSHTHRTQKMQPNSRDDDDDDGEDHEEEEEED
jgi:hypothetical protein